MIATAAYSLSHVFLCLELFLFYIRLLNKSSISNIILINNNLILVSYNEGISIVSNLFYVRNSIEKCYIILFNYFNKFIGLSTVYKLLVYSNLVFQSNKFFDFYV